MTEPAARIASGLPLPTLEAEARPVELGAIAGYLNECRAHVLDEIRALVPTDQRHTGGLYALMLDYPFRPAKALRPAVCLATCRMLGGALEAALPSAAALELLHNAFLLHDDVEDGSELRRGRPTLHREHGVAAAVNVGDGMLALALRPLLDNCRHVGISEALRVLEIFTETARVSAEGQAMELQWIDRVAWDQSDAEYVRMVYKKTAHYSFVAPAAIGCVIGGASTEARRHMERFAALLGVAFQIRDDALNLTAGEADYGKEIGGDLWEGKHTLILLTALRRATPSARLEAESTLRALGARSHAGGQVERRPEDVASLLELIHSTGAIEAALGLARRHALRARRSLSRAAAPPSIHRSFLEALVDYVVDRDR
jgi:geranylgeranyl diphosphate synthase type II